MGIKLYVWQGARGGWLCHCPVLEIGGTGNTRSEALRRARSEADNEARMIFGTGIEVVEGSPPPMEDWA
jgi:hypothetical protein